MFRTISKPSGQNQTVAAEKLLTGLKTNLNPTKVQLRQSGKFIQLRLRFIPDWDLN